MLSNGTPMFVAGDEFLQTQGGNPNPWNLDSPTTWLDWSLAERNADIVEFFRGMIAFRKAHHSIGRGTGWASDVTWHGVGSEPDLRRDSHTIAFHLRGQEIIDDDIYVMVNAYEGALNFGIHASGPWYRSIDTALESPPVVAIPPDLSPIGDLKYMVAPHSIVVLLKPANSGLRNSLEVSRSDGN